MERINIPRKDFYATSLSDKRTKKLTQWLGSVPLVEKIKSLEKGQLVQCVKCCKVFFGPETDEERNERNRVSSRERHECFPFRDFVILERGFVGIKKVVDYSPPKTLEEAIVEYFIKH